MNHIYKIVWNKARECYMVVCEYAKSQTKGCSTARLFANKRAAKAAVAMLMAGAISVGVGVQSAYAEGDNTEKNGGTITVQKASSIIKTSIADGEDSIVALYGENNTIFGAIAKNGSIVADSEIYTEWDPWSQKDVTRVKNTGNSSLMMSVLADHGGTISGWGNGSAIISSFADNGGVISTNGRSVIISSSTDARYTGNSKIETKSDNAVIMGVSTSGDVIAGGNAAVIAAKADGNIDIGGGAFSTGGLVENVRIVGGKVDYDSSLNPKGGNIKVTNGGSVIGVDVYNGDVEATGNHSFIQGSAVSAVYSQVFKGYVPSTAGSIKATGDYSSISSAYVDVNSSVTASGLYSTIQGVRAAGVYRDSVGGSYNLYHDNNGQKGTITARGVFSTIIGASAGSGDVNAYAPFATIIGSENSSVGTSSSISNTTLKNVAGVHGTVIGSYNSSSTGSFATVLGGYDSSASSYGGFAVGPYARANSGDISIGAYSNATGSHAVAVGNTAKATSTNTTAVGYNSSATNQNATAVGYKSSASNVNTTAIGYNSSATGTDALAAGVGSKATGKNSIAITTVEGSEAKGEHSVVIGAEASTAEGKHSVILGSSDSNTLKNYGTVIGSTNVADVSQYSSAIASNNITFKNGGGSYNAISAANKINLQGGSYNTISGSRDVTVLAPKEGGKGYGYNGITDFATVLGADVHDIGTDKAGTLTVAGDGATLIGVEVDSNAHIGVSVSSHGAVMTAFANDAGTKIIAGSEDYDDESARPAGVVVMGAMAYKGGQILSSGSASSIRSVIASGGEIKASGILSNVQGAYAYGNEDGIGKIEAGGYLSKAEGVYAIGGGEIKAAGLLSKAEGVYATSGGEILASNSYSKVESAYAALDGKITASGYMSGINSAYAKNGGEISASGGYSNVEGAYAVDGAKVKAEGSLSTMHGVRATESGKIAAAYGMYSSVIGSTDSVAGAKTVVPAEDGGEDQVKYSGKYATVIGAADSTASGEHSLVLGSDKVEAVGDYSAVIVSDPVKASGKYSVVVGSTGTKKNEEYSTEAKGDYATIVGSNDSKALANHTTVIGSSSSTAGEKIVTPSPEEGGQDTITYSGAYATVIGSNKSEATGERSAVIASNNSKAIGKQDVVLGGSGNIANSRGSLTTATSTIPSGHSAAVVGGHTNAVYADSSAIIAGNHNTINSADTVSGHAGEDSGIFAGSFNTVSQEADESAIVAGTQNTMNGFDSVIAGGAGNKVEGSARGAAILGGIYNTIGNSDDPVVGTENYDASASPFGAAVLGGGYNEVNSRYGTVVGGYKNTVEGKYATAVGGRLNAVESTATDSVILGGYGNTAKGARSAIVGGYNSTTANNYDIAIGAYSQTTENDKAHNEANGYETAAKLKYKGEVVQEYAGVATDHGIISVGGGTDAEGNVIYHQIQNLAAGDVSATSTDAINGSQLYALGSVVENISTKVDNFDTTEVKSASPRIDVTSTKNPQTNVTTYSVSINKFVDVDKAGYANKEDSSDPDKHGWSMTQTQITKNEDGSTTTNTATFADTTLVGGDAYAGGDSQYQPDRTYTGSDYSFKDTAGNEVTLKDIISGNDLANYLSTIQTTNTETLAIDDFSPKSGIEGVNTDKIAKVNEDGEVSLSIKQGDTTFKVGITNIATKNDIQDIHNIIGDTNNINEEIGGDTLVQNINNTYEVAKKHTTVVEGDNINVTEGVNAEGGKEYTVSLKKDIDVDSVKVGNTINITKEGINAGNTKIINVKAGTDDTDAVNVSQLKEEINNRIEQYNNLSNRIENTYEEGKKHTTVVEGDNINVTEGVNAEGGKEYTVSLKKDIDVDSVKVGNTINITKNGVNVGGTKITNVLAGTDDTDAVNLSQLKDETNKRIEGEINLNKRIDNTYEEAKKHTTVVEGANINVTEGVNTEGGKEYTVSLKKDIDVDSVKVGDTINITNEGVNVGDTKITNVKAGTADTDAVNVSQLKDETNKRIEGDTNLNNRINKLGSRMNKGIAGAAALAALHPMDFDPDDKLTFAAGVGNYGGENAVAIGAFYRPDEKVMFNIGGTLGNGENIVNAGVSFSLDRTPRVTNTKTAMARDIIDLKEQVATLTNLVHQLTGVTGQARDMFPDVPENHWAYEYVKGLVDNGVLVAYPDGLFDGERPGTRYEFAAMLYRAMNKGIILPDRVAKEFAPEIGRFRVDRIHGADDDNHKIERIRVNGDHNYGRDNYGSKNPQPVTSRGPQYPESDRISK